MVGIYALFLIPILRTPYADRSHVCSGRRLHRESRISIRNEEQKARYARLFANRSARVVSSREFKKPPPKVDMLLERAKEILRLAPDKSEEAQAANTAIIRNRKAGEKEEARAAYHKTCLTQYIKTWSPSVVVEIGSMIEAVGGIVQGVKDFKEQIAEFGREGVKIERNGSAKQEEWEKDFYTRIADNELTMIDGFLETMERILKAYDNAQELNIDLNNELDADRNRAIKDELNTTFAKEGANLDSLDMEGKRKLMEKLMKESEVPAIYKNWKVDVANAFALGLQNLKAHKKTTQLRKGNLIRKYIIKDPAAWDRSSKRHLPIMVDDKPLMPQMQGIGVYWFKILGVDRSASLMTEIRNNYQFTLSRLEGVITSGKFEDEKEYEDLLDKQDQAALIIEKTRVLQMAVNDLVALLEHYQNQMASYFRNCNVAKREVRLERMKQRHQSKEEITTLQNQVKRKQGEFELSKLNEIRESYSNMFSKARDAQKNMPDANKNANPDDNPYVEAFGELPSSKHLMDGVWDKSMEMHNWLKNEIEIDMLKFKFPSMSELRAMMVKVGEQDDALIQACDTTPKVSGQSVVYMSSVSSGTSMLPSGTDTGQDISRLPASSAQEPSRKSGASSAAVSMQEPQLSGRTGMPSIQESRMSSIQESLPFHKIASVGMPSIIQEPLSPQGVPNSGIASMQETRRSGVSDVLSLQDGRLSGISVQELPRRSGASSAAVSMQEPQLSGRTGMPSMQESLPSQRRPDSQVSSAQEHRRSGTPSSDASMQELPPAADSGFSAKSAVVSPHMSASVGVSVADLEQSLSRLSGMSASYEEKRVSVRNVVSSAPVEVSEDPKDWPAMNDKSNQDFWMCDERNIEALCNTYHQRDGAACKFERQKGATNGFWDGQANLLGQCMAMKNGGDCQHSIIC